MSVTDEEARYLMSVGYIGEAVHTVNGEVSFEDICRKLKDRESVTTMAVIKLFFSVEEVAKICKVAPRVIYRWINAGKLTTTTDGITRESLIGFMKSHGLSADHLSEKVSM
jgi:hypothetical protein